MSKDNNEDECVVFKVPLDGDHSYSLGEKMKQLLESVTKKTEPIVYTSSKNENYFQLKCKTPKQLLSIIDSNVIVTVKFHIQVKQKDI